MSQHCLRPFHYLKKLVETACCVLLVLMLLAYLPGALVGCSEGPPPGASPYAGEAHRLPSLDESEKALLLDVAEQAIEDAITGRGDRFEPLEAFANTPNRAYVILWQRGRKLYSWWSQHQNLSTAVYRATRKVLEHRRPGGAAGLDVHIQVLGRDIPWSEEGYRHGFHGVSMRKRSAVNYYASWAVETNVRQAKLLRRLSERLQRIDPSEVPAETFYFPALHFARGFGRDQITTFYMGSTPSFDPAVSESRFRALRERAARWLRSALAESGEFRYLFYPSRDEFPAGKNNMIRQLMASRTLAGMAARDATLLPLHSRNLQHVFEHWYREDGDQAYIFFQGKSKLGANAMAVRTLVYSPLFDAYQPQAARLVAGILALQAESGAFRPWYIEPDYAYDADRLLTFYSGEALLALFEYYRKSGDAAVLSAARRGQEFYLTRYVQQMDRFYYPAYVPWHTQSLHALYRITGESRFADAVFVMTDKLLEMQDRGAGGDSYTLGRFYNPATPQYGSPHASSDAVYTEGLAYAYELASLEGDEMRMQRYRRALLLGLHNLDNLQYRGRRLYFLRRPQMSDGALRIHTTDNKIRVDTTQHALDAFEKIADLVASGVLALDP